MRMPQQRQRHCRRSCRTAEVHSQLNYLHLECTDRQPEQQQDQEQEMESLTFADNEIALR